MLKQKALQKKLIKTAVIVLAITAVLGTGAIYIYSWATGVSEEFVQAERQLRNTEREITAKETKAADAEKYVELYEALNKEDGRTATALNREIGQKWLQQVGTDIGLLGLEGNFDPIQPIGGKFEKEYVEGITSRVRLSIKGITDEQLIQFLGAIEEQFPGFVKLLSFQLTRQASITNNFLRQVSNGYPPVLVSGEVEFEWVGLREVTAPEAEEGAQSNATGRR